MVHLLPEQQPFISAFDLFSFFIIGQSPVHLPSFMHAILPSFIGQSPPHLPSVMQAILPSCMQAILPSFIIGQSAVHLPSFMHVILPSLSLGQSLQQSAILALSPWWQQDIFCSSAFGAGLSAGAAVCANAIAASSNSAYTLANTFFISFSILTVGGWDLAALGRTSARARALDPHVGLQVEHGAHGWQRRRHLPAP